MDTPVVDELAWARGWLVARPHASPHGTAVHARGAGGSSAEPGQARGAAGAGDGKGCAVLFGRACAGKPAGASTARPNGGGALFTLVAGLTNGIPRCWFTAGVVAMLLPPDSGLTVTALSLPPATWTAVHSAGASATPPVRCTWSSRRDATRRSPRRRGWWRRRRRRCERRPVSTKGDRRTSACMRRGCVAGGLRSPPTSRGRPLTAVARRCRQTAARDPASLVRLAALPAAGRGSPLRGRPRLLGWAAWTVPRGGRGTGGASATPQALCAPRRSG